MATYDDILGRLMGHLERIAPAGTDLSEDTNLVRTLSLDSTTLIDILLDVEDEFDVMVPLNALSDIETAGELATLIHRLAQED